MLNAYAMGKHRMLEKFDEVKCELLLKYGVPKRMLWLTDLDITNDEKGIVFFMKVETSLLMDNLT